jgi:hypothetical protein
MNSDALYTRLSLETEALKDFRWWRLERKQIAKSLLKETGTHLRIVEVRHPHIQVIFA